MLFKQHGSVAHLGERLICIQEVEGSIPFRSTKLNDNPKEEFGVLYFESILVNGKIGFKVWIKLKTINI